MAETETKGGLARKILALILGALAAKLAMTAVEQFWTRGLRKDVPEMSGAESALKKVAWIGLTAAAVGIARQLAREVTAPRTKA